MEEKFFMTYARSRPNELVPWIEENNVPLLTNAVHRWSENTDRFLSMWEYDTTHVIDPGGYNVQNRYVDRGGNITQDPTETLDQESPFYPWTIDEYHNWLTEHSHEFEWAAAMDYTTVDQFDSLWTKEERIERTFDNTLKHFSKNPEYKLLPVLQGTCLEEYIEFYERLRDYGIPTDHVGLGSIQPISSSGELVDLERELREATDIQRIHGFGVKVNGFKQGVTFDTADSQAWCYAPTNGRCLIDDGDKLREIQMGNDSLTRTVESFKNYYKYVTRLQQGTSAVDYNSGVDEMTDAEAVKSLSD
jgi:hypothetical protein